METEFFQEYCCPAGRLIFKGLLYCNLEVKLRHRGMIMDSSGSCGTLCGANRGFSISSPKINSIASHAAANIPRSAAFCVLPGILK